jgi:hypothetical protein
LKGAVPEGDLLVSATANSRWQLAVAGQAATQSKAFGWAMSFGVAGGGGTATLRYRTPVTRLIIIGVEGLLWAVAIGLVFWSWRRRSLVEHVGPDLSITAEWLEEEDEGPIPTPVRRRPRRVAEPVGVDSDELWSP